MSQRRAPVKAVIVGAGSRATQYAAYSEEHPDELQIVGVVDPHPKSRARAIKRFNIPADRQYASVEELVAVPQFADAAINGTMDREHVPTTLPLLRAGYHVLLEKPFAISDEEVDQLTAAVEASGKLVVVCHVMRHTPYYTAIRERIAAGEIGELVSIRTVEHVIHHHIATAYVRGKWGRSEVAPMLLAKCSHDLDALCWMLSGIRPLRVASFGNRSYFREDKAPAGSGTRCLTDCKIENDCLYSAKKLYVDSKMWNYPWRHMDGYGFREFTAEEKLESLRTDNPYGRCVWRCDNDVVDRQTVIIEFENGVVGTHEMIGPCSKGGRQIHLIGTNGEIEGTREDGYFVVRHPDLNAEGLYTEERVDIPKVEGGHGGGDLRLVADFVRVVRGEKPSLSTTVLGDSIAGHRIAFAADRAMRERAVVELPEESVTMNAGASALAV